MVVNGGVQCRQILLVCSIDVTGTAARPSKTIQLISFISASIAIPTLSTNFDNWRPDMYPMIFIIERKYLMIWTILFRINKIVKKLNVDACRIANFTTKYNGIQLNSLKRLYVYDYADYLSCMNQVYNWFPVLQFSIHNEPDIWMRSRSPRPSADHWSHSEPVARHWPCIVIAAVHFAMNTLFCCPRFN